MTRCLRFVAPLLFAIGALTVPVPAASVKIDTTTQWAKTDVPVDPTVTLGTLPNGLRYVIKHNTHPENGVSFILRVGTGSFQETPKQAGLSHFVEHMAFRGTTHIADGETIKMLQSVGVGFGTDSNAYTAADATVYFFDFPKNDKTALDTGFLLTREIAGEVAFKDDAVASERQVVLAEYRLRDTPPLHAARASLIAQYGERLGEAFLPIGTTETIGAATAGDLKAYYEARYRPENMVLIVVGDVDVKAIEQEIAARFAAWKPQAAKTAAPVYTMPDPLHKAEVKLFSEKGAQNGVQLSWTGPYDATPETRARDSRDTAREIALRVLNTRYRELATSAAPPFLAAGAATSNHQHVAFVASMSANAGSGDPLMALKALRQTLLLALRDGVSQDEVDRAVAQQRTAITATVTAAPSRKSNQLASTYGAVAATNDVIDGPENWLPTFEAGVKDLTAQRVTAVLKELFGGHEPLIFVSSPTPLAGGEAAVAAAYAEGGTLPAPSGLATAPVAWPYTDFGPAGSIATRQEVADLGTTLVSFANGVRATIKPTKWQAGQIEISVRFGHGRLGFPKDKAVPGWAIAGALGGGGVGKLSNADLPKALTGKQVAGTPEVGESAFLLEGHTRKEDFLAEMQLLTAFLTDPAWRPEGLKRTQSGTATGLAQAVTTAPGIFSLNLGAIQHAYDKRFLPPTPESVKAADLESVKALVETARQNGPLEVVIVGDVAVDEALAALKTTFGALAKREVETKPLPGDEELPKSSATPIVLRYTGASREAMAMLAWKTTGTLPNPQIQRTLTVLEQIMRQRLFDELRTKEGLTYSPQTHRGASMHTAGWGYLAVMTMVPAEKLPAFYGAVEKVAAALREKEVPADEFERARGPLVAEAQHGEETNGYWLNALAGAQVEPRTLDLIRSHISSYKSVTAADVLKAAQTYLKDERAYRVIAAPEGFEIPALPQ